MVNWALKAAVFARKRTFANNPGPRAGPWHRCSPESAPLSRGARTALARRSRAGTRGAVKGGTRLTSPLRTTPWRPSRRPSCHVNVEDAKLRPTKSTESAGMLLFVFPPETSVCGCLYEEHPGADAPLAQAPWKAASPRAARKSRRHCRNAVSKGENSSGGRPCKHVCMV